MVFGGENFVSGAFLFLNDTWEYAPATNTWTPAVVTPPVPPARAVAVMAYDPVRRVTVLFGGTNDFSGTQRFADTWEWNGTTWRPAATTGPFGRTQAQMAWDPSRNRIVLYGGYSSAGLTNNELWEWDGVAWTQRMGIGSGPARAAGNLVFDSNRGRLVLVTGLSTGVNTSTDTSVWELGPPWATITAPGTPARYAASSVYDPSTSSILVIGGVVTTTPQPNTYFLTGSSWTSISAPAAIGFAGAALDSNRGRVYLFGGIGSSLVRLNSLLIY